MTSIQFVCNNHLFSVFKGKTICFHINLVLLSGVGKMSLFPALSVYVSTSCVELCVWALNRKVFENFHGGEEGMRM